MLNFHPGELQVQERAGVRKQAEALARNSLASHMYGRVQERLAWADLAVIGVDLGLPAPALLSVTGEPSELLVPLSKQVLAIRPEHEVQCEAWYVSGSRRVALVSLCPRTGDRARISGSVISVKNDTMVLRVEEAMTNCRRYNKPRAPICGTLRSYSERNLDRETWAPVLRQTIGQADSFFIGSGIRQTRIDVAQRRGESGFVLIDDDATLIWEDYPGNNLFQTLGNIVSEPAVALLFLDFAKGAFVRLEGQALVCWDNTDGRRYVKFCPSEIYLGWTASPRIWAPDNAGDGS